MGCIVLATDEDIQYGLDKWVALFKSRTWEELKMLASEKPELLAASESLYKYNREEDIRQQCIAREEYRKKMNRIEHQLAEKDNIIAEQNSTIAEQAAYIEKLEAVLAQNQLFHVTHKQFHRFNFRSNSNPP